MKYRHIKFIGISRPIPDITTFVTPVFIDGENNFLIQKTIDGIIIGFEITFFEKEFQEMELDVFVKIGSPEIHVFEYQTDCFILGDSNLLVLFLTPLYAALAKRRPQTAKSILQFIASQRQNIKSLSDSSQHTFRIFYIDVPGKWESEWIDLGTFSETSKQILNEIVSAPKNLPNKRSSNSSEESEANHIRNINHLADCADNISPASKRSSELSGFSVIDGGGSICIENAEISFSGEGFSRKTLELTQCLFFISNSELAKIIKAVLSQIPTVPQDSRHYSNIEEIYFNDVLLTYFSPYTVNRILTALIDMGEIAIASDGFDVNYMSMLRNCITEWYTIVEWELEVKIEQHNLKIFPKTS